MNVDLDIDGAVATITLQDAATRNALDDEALVAIRAQLDAVSARSDISLVVIRGEGNAFSSGGSRTAVSELAELSESEAGRTEIARRIRVNSSLIERILEQPQMTIALITGPAVGASLGIAGACDLRFAVPKAKFLPAFGALGLTTDLGTTSALRRVLNDAVVNAWFIRGDAWTAEGAHERGLVDELAPLEELLEQIQQLAAAISPREGSRIARQRELSIDKDAFSAELDREATAFAQSISTPLAQERLMALLSR